MTPIWRLMEDALEFFRLQASRHAHPLILYPVSLMIRTYLILYAKCKRVITVHMLELVLQHWHLGIAPTSS